MKGLVLQGGGAKGAFQVGAIKALIELGHSFDGVVGVSIGAINAAFVAQGDMDLAYKMWYDINFEQLMGIDKDMADKVANMQINMDVAKFVFKELKRAISGRGLDLTQGRDYYKKYINEEMIRSSHMDYGLVTIEYEKGFTPRELFKEDIPEGFLYEYIMASSNLPFFKGIEIEGKKFYDGGFYDNLPVNMLIDRGYDEIIAIRLGKSVARFQDIKDGDYKITYIDPSDEIGSLMNFTESSVRNAMQRGYYDARRVMLGNMGKKYFFKPFLEEEFSNYLLLYPEEFFNIILKILSIDYIEDRPQSIDLIIEEIGLLIGSRKYASKLEIITDFLEIFGDYAGINMYREYNVINFLYRILRVKNMDISSGKIRFIKWNRIEKIWRTFAEYAKITRLT